MSRVSFRCVDGQHYLCAEIDGRVVADRTEVGEWEQWQVEAVDGGLAFLSAHGRYLSAQPDGRLVANREVAGPWETFTVVPGDGGVGLRSVHSTFVVAEGGGGGAVRADRAYDAPGPWETFTPSMPLSADRPPGGHPDPVDGQVSIQDGAWCVGGRPRNIAGVHLGNAIGHAMAHGVPAIAPTLDLAQELGFHEARMWFQLKTLPGGWWDRWSTPRWNPADDRVLFAETLAATAQRGIKMHLAGGGIRDMSDGEENAAFGTLNWAIGQVGPEHFSVIEACNEIRDTGDEDDIDPKELTRLVRLATEGYPQILTALSAYTGTEDKDILRRYTPSWMRFYIVHGERGGHMHDKLRHMYSLAHDGEGEPVRRNMKQSESYGPGRLVSATSNSHEINAHTMTLSAAMCAIARGQWTFMSGPGVVLETEPLADMAGLRETPEILRRLPQDLAQFQTLGHGGDSKRGQRIYAALDDWRYDYAINNDGRYVGIAYGPPEQHSPDDLRKERITFDDEVLADGPYGRVTTGRLN